MLEPTGGVAVAQYERRKGELGEDACVFEESDSVLHGIGDLQALQIVLVDEPTGELLVLHPCEQTPPKKGVIKDDGYFFGFLALDKRDDFKKFIECSDTTRHYHERSCIFSKDDFTSGKAVKSETDVLVGVACGFKGKEDIETNAETWSAFGPAISCFHDAWAPACEYVYVLAGDGVGEGFGCGEGEGGGLSAGAAENGDNGLF